MSSLRDADFVLKNINQTSIHSPDQLSDLPESFRSSFSTQMPVKRPAATPSVQPLSLRWTGDKQKKRQWREIKVRPEYKAEIAALQHKTKSDKRVREETKSKIINKAERYKEIKRQVEEIQQRET